jgi:hypothetical protein
MGGAADECDTSCEALYCSLLQQLLLLLLLLLYCLPKERL